MCEGVFFYLLCVKNTMATVHPPRLLAQTLPLGGRKQVDFANEVQRNRYGFPADTKYRGNCTQAETKVLPQRGRGPRSGAGGEIFLYFFQKSLFLMLKM